MKDPKWNLDDFQCLEVIDFYNFWDYKFHRACSVNIIFSKVFSARWHADQIGQVCNWFKLFSDHERLSLIADSAHNKPCDEFPFRKLDIKDISLSLVGIPYNTIFESPRTCLS